MSTTPHRPWTWRAILHRHLQPRRGVLRRRRGRQDHHRRGDGAAGRRVRPHRRGADHRPGQAAGPGAGHQGPRQHAAAGSAGARGARRAARDDARHAPHVRRDGDPVLRTRTGREAILDNQFYQTVATSLAGTQEYMAMEKLGQLLAQDKWDLVVVDTPPSRNALDFLDAPKRLGSFMDSRLWRLLLAPGRGIGRLVTGAVGLAMKALSTVLGSQMLSDAAAFVQSLDATFGGFREKADRTYELLKRRGTQFVVVSAAEPDALREASFFVDRLSAGAHAAGRADPQPHPPDAVRPARRQGRQKRPRSWTTKDPDVAGGGGAADSRRPGDDGQAGDPAAVAVHRRQPARGDRRACRRCRSTCRISRRCAPSPIRSPARRPRRSRESAERRSPLDRAAVFALGGEEVGPGNHLGVLLEQGAALAFGHAAPDAELDAVVQGVGAAFEDHRAVPADHCGFALGRAADEQFVGIGLAAASLGNPGDTGLGLCALDKAVG